MPDELIAVLEVLQGLDGGQLTGQKRVGSTLSDGSAETIGTKGTHVADHGEVELDLLTSGTGGLEGVSLVTALRLIIISPIRLQTLDDNMVVPGGRGWVSCRDLGRGETVELSTVFTEVHSRVGQLLIRIPADGHAIITGVSQANLDRCSLGIAQGWVGRTSRQGSGSKGHHGRSSHGAHDRRHG